MRVVHQWSYVDSITGQGYTWCGRKLPEDHVAYPEDWKYITCKLCLKKQKSVSS